MSTWVFRVAIMASALWFTAFFATNALPALLDDPDIGAALAAGMANPFAATYSIDALASWLILSAWIVYEWLSRGVKYGWVCILLGLCPGLALGFALYLIVRAEQLDERTGAGEAAP